MTMNKFIVALDVSFIFPVINSQENSASVMKINIVIPQA